MTGPEHLCARVLAQYGVTWEEIVGRDRRPCMVEARDAVFWTLHQHQPSPYAHEFSYSAIGLMVGGRGAESAKGGVDRHEARLVALDRIRERSYTHAFRPMERAA